ncbi:MAG: sigma-70 family RNA polymerase sigma factor [Acidobacteriota bacterium]
MPSSQDHSGGRARRLDQRLVERARAGEPEAFEELMRRYERLVYKVAVSFGGDRESGLDLTQNIFLKAFRGLDRLGPESHFKAWLMRIAFNEGVNWQRRHDRHRGQQPMDAELDLPSPRPGPEADFDRGDQQRQLLRGLERLRPRYRMAISLRYFQGLRVREIAEVLDCSESMAKQLLFKGVRSLRAAVAEAAA